MKPLKPSPGILNQAITITRSSVIEDILIASIEEKYDIKENEIEVEEVKSNGNGKWEPKNWSAEYELVVMMHLAGRKGVEIAELTGYTPQHVYNILGTPQAIAIEKAVIAKRRKDLISITDEIDTIQKLTVRRLRKSLENDDVFSKTPLGFISKGIEIMKGTGEYIKNSTNTEVRNNTFILPPSVADRFLDGLEKSDKAKLLLSENIEDAVIVEDKKEEEEK